MNDWIEKIKKNHGLMMGVCCILPIAILFVAVKYFDLNRSYLFWGVLLLCPVLHYFMMKDMHKGKGDKKEKNR